MTRSTDISMEARGIVQLLIAYVDGLPYFVVYVARYCKMAGQLLDMTKFYS